MPALPRNAPLWGCHVESAVRPQVKPRAALFSARSSAGIDRGAGRDYRLKQWGDPVMHSRCSTALADQRSQQLMLSDDGQAGGLHPSVGLRMQFASTSRGVMLRVSHLGRSCRVA